MSERRYHDLPMSRREVVEALLEDLEEQERRPFERFAEILAAIFHHEFHERLEQLKNAYRPINPDLDWRPKTELSDAEQSALSDSVETNLRDVLTRGNYRRLGEADLDHAFAEKSLFPIDVHVDFEVVDDFVVYARGSSTMEAEVKIWFGLRKKKVTVPTYERVCLYLRFKDDPQQQGQRKKMLTYEPGLTVMKLFRNIPKADLEMLFPNTRLRMRLKDKLWIGVPAVVGGVPIAFKLVPAFIAIMILLGLRRGNIDYLSVLAGLGGLTGLGIFVFRQWDKFQSRKMLFLKTLSENLYFRNIDNNEGVLTRLVDEAEEEEHKEALLAYFFLLRDAESLDAAALDERVESWLSERFDVDVDFEIDDALGKLVRLELAVEEDGRYSVVSLDEALALLRGRWAGLLF